MIATNTSLYFQTAYVCANRHVKLEKMTKENYKVLKWTYRVEILGYIINTQKVPFDLTLSMLRTQVI